jgi:hypothetical protein
VSKCHDTPTVLRYNSTVNKKSLNFFITEL